MPGEGATEELWVLIINLIEIKIIPKKLQKRIQVYNLHCKLSHKIPPYQQSFLLQIMRLRSPSWTLRRWQLRKEAFCFCGNSPLVVYSWSLKCYLFVIPQYFLRIWVLRLSDQKHDFALVLQLFHLLSSRYREWHLNGKKMRMSCEFQIGTHGVKSKEIKLLWLLFPIQTWKVGYIVLL